ncbi:MAG: thiamine-phosphate kinase [Gammaproteobacteria bacterium]|nr:thiamine-phosphate kinase [Gammaproteobacteria bacterium]
MAQNEFAIIQQYFSAIGEPAASTVLGIGDDAAVVEVPVGYQQVVSMDTLIAGVHFPEDTSPADIAYKALAVNLSDLAAMAATPNWFLLSLSLPHSDPPWLEAFADGLRKTAAAFRLQLIGGDTCHGALSISIQVAGLVPAGEFVSRAGASAGDLILVSGELGGAGLGLAHLQGRIDLPEALRADCLQALNRPRPRLELSDFLRRFASAAIDISDGLQGDLAHILKASHCGARIDRAAIPVVPWIERQDLYQLALGGGDDYEICCTVAPKYRAEIENWNRLHAHCRLSTIGEITDTGFDLCIGDKITDLSQAQGYRHFG